MRFYTGDDVGLIKGVDIDPTVSLLDAQAAAAKKLRLEAKAKKAAGIVAAKGDTSSGSVGGGAAGEAVLEGVEVWTQSGTVSRGRSIQQMAVSKAATGGDGDAGAVFVVARADGTVEAIARESGAVVDSHTEQGFAAPVCIKHSGRQITERRYVGVGAVGGTSFISCTNLGEVRCQRFGEAEEPRVLLKLPVEACRMRVHAKSPRVFAVGGREQELSVWDVDAVGSAAAAAAAEYRKPTTAPLFRAKNVRPDSLGLRVPVWITDIQFLSDSATAPTVAVSTGHRQIRIYDARAGARPMHDWSDGVSAHPITNLLASHAKPELFFTDNVGGLHQLDLRAGRVVGGYRGFAGAVTSVALSEDGAMVAGAGLDRFVRVYEADGMRRLLHRAYVKQRVAQLHWDWSVRDASPDEAERREEDELWDAMDTRGSKRKAAAC
ncbi:Ribosome biogenesis protein nsa1 (NOP7-associated protein 1) [Coemansia sp. RSA 2049]|nr:Ribosome biogenesis protein nsa1 (NOP7-associated protein 1) [Coemansia sp. RSA 2049]KAJ2520413.1 Ribosome biogenesis protein nsa1 (NOP7-associated protein 1) [Coemansia sp. RSA 1939]KAJ2594473.1 Ribosome biogenesis protein nsa1 (NOP7-associated protein 1) [Coemansia sp. RSA 1804]